MKLIIQKCWQGQRGRRRREELQRSNSPSRSAAETGQANEEGKTGVKREEMREQMGEVQELVWTTTWEQGVGVPQGRCSRECRRRCAWCRLLTCPPCTSRSRLSLCVPRCRAAHYPALDLWERRRRITQVWIILIDNIFGYKRRDESVSRLCAVRAPNQATLDEQPTSLPVDDAFAVEEEEAGRYLRSVKPGGRQKRRRRGLTTGCFIFQKIGQQGERRELKRVMKGRETE